MGALKGGRIALQILVLALLGACAGGGGGGGGGGGVMVTPPTPPPSPPPPPASPPPLPPLAPPHGPGSFPSASSAEYQADWAVAGTNAFVAWQHGSTGQGVKIGVIDDGIVATSDPSYAELTGRIDPASTDIIAGRNQLNSTLSHGSELSALIAGNFNGGQTVGLAFDATIVAVRADDGTSSFQDSDLAAGINYAVAHGVKVINLSLGKDSPADFSLVQAITDATAAGVIFAISAGNCGQGSAANPECSASAATQVNYPGFYASNAAISHGLILIGGGLNQNGTVNTISNPPGSNANFYLTAPGWGIIVPDFGPTGPVPGFQRCGPPNAPTADTCQIQGTSYASPQITGAVALLMAAFPGLTPTQVVNLLLVSADDTGPVGVDSVNGAGRLNIGRAFQPVGNLASPLAENGVEIAPDSMLGMAGAAFGDGLSKSSAAWTTIAFDSFDRAFTVNFSHNWASAPAGPAMVAEAPQLWRNAHTENGVRMSFAQAEDVVPESYHSGIARNELEQPSTRIEGEIAPGLTMAFATQGTPSLSNATEETRGHLAFVNSDTSVSLTRRLSHLASVSFLSQSGEARVGLMQDRSARKAQATRFSFGLDRLGLDVTYGQIRDEEGLLGFVWSDLLGQTPGGEIRFAGLAGHYEPAPNWRLSFEAESGAAQFAHPGWLDLAAPLRTSAFSLQATYAATPTWLDRFGLARDNGHGAFTFSVTQPLRVEEGVLQARLPTATAYGRKSLSYETRDIDVTPSGRELRVGLGYDYYAGDWLSAFGEALYVSQPGHVADAEPQSVVRFGVRLRN